MSIFMKFGFVLIAGGMAVGATQLETLSEPQSVSDFTSHIHATSAAVLTQVRSALPADAGDWQILPSRPVHVSTSHRPKDHNAITFVRGREMVTVAERQASEAEASTGLLADFERNFKTAEVVREKRVSVLGQRENMRFLKVPGQDGGEKSRFVAVVDDKIALDVVSTASDEDTWAILKTFDIAAFKAGLLGADTAQAKPVAKKRNPAKCTQVGGRKVCRVGG